MAPVNEFAKLAERARLALKDDFTQKSHVEKLGEVVRQLCLLLAKQEDEKDADSTTPDAQ